MSFAYRTKKLSQNLDWDNDLLLSCIPYTYEIVYHDSIIMTLLQNLVNPK
jgi:hypothetical protein